MNYITYYRVSTEDQGKSGLGLEAQKELCRKFVNESGTLIAEYEDIESGTSDTRTGLLKAIKHAKETKSMVVVKELSRITRGGYEMQQLFDSMGVKYIEAYSQYDSELIKAVKLEFAKEEVRKIRDRTKDALDQIKKKIAEDGFYVTKGGRTIKSLGSPQNLSKKAVKRSVAVRKEKALNNPNNVKAGALVLALREKGMSYPQIAAELNEKGFKTSRGGEFGRVQAQRLYTMYKYKG